MVIVARTAAKLPKRISKISGTVILPKFLMRLAMKYIKAIPSQAPALDHKAAGPLR